MPVLYPFDISWYIFDILHFIALCFTSILTVFSQNNFLWCYYCARDIALTTRASFITPITSAIVSRYCDKEITNLLPLGTIFIAYGHRYCSRSPKPHFVSLYNERRVIWHNISIIMIPFSQLVSIFILHISNRFMIISLVYKIALFCQT